MGGSFFPSQGNQPDLGRSLGRSRRGRLRIESSRRRATFSGAWTASRNCHHVPRAYNLRHRWAAIGRKPDPITQNAAVFIEGHVVINDESGAVAVEEGAGYSVASILKNVKAAIHQHHGLLTPSRHSIEDAAFWLIALARVCQQRLLVEEAESSRRW
jgi:hypothetical protein